MTPTWQISRKEAAWVAEQQAAILVAEIGEAAPPIPVSVLMDLVGVRVHALDDLPVTGLESASQPTPDGGDIVLDAALPDSERHYALLCELKHLIDSGRTDVDACEAFAEAMLLPKVWLQTQDASATERSPQ